MLLAPKAKVPPASVTKPPLEAVKPPPPTVNEPPARSRASAVLILCAAASPFHRDRNPRLVDDHVIGGGGHGATAPVARIVPVTALIGRPGDREHRPLFQRFQSQGGEPQAAAAPALLRMEMSLTARDLEESANSARTLVDPHFRFPREKSCVSRS